MADRLRVLIVAGEPALREMLESLLEDEGYDSTAVPELTAALELANEQEFDAVLCDLETPGSDGHERLGFLRDRWPHTPVILLAAGGGSGEATVQALRGGAFDCVAKPLQRGALLASLTRAFHQRRLEAENRRLRRALERALMFPDEGQDASAHGPREGAADSLLRAGVDRRMSLRDVGDRYIEAVLALTRGNKVQAARILGINRRTLYRRTGSGAAQAKGRKDAGPAARSG
jgi:DNA-binding NtrC family response regulator